MQSHADIEEGRPGRRRRRVAWPSPGTGPGGQSAPISASGRFYSALGLAGGDGSRSGNWLELESLGGSLGLHIVRESHGDGAREVELSFVSGEPLGTVAARLAAAGFEAGPIMDENFGRSMVIHDPDGAAVQINELDPELYT